MSGLVFLMIILIGTAAISIGISQAKKTNEAWAAAAKKLQLVFQPSQLFSRPRISGIHNGCSVLVTTFSKSSGKHQTTYTRYRVSYPKSLDMGLRLTRQGMLSGIGKLLGAQDIEVGEQGFDDAVVVKGRDPERVVQFLTPARRMRAARFLTLFQGAVIDDNRVQWERRHVERDPEKITKMIQRMTSLAIHMMEDRADDAAIDKAIEARQDGRMDDALEIVREVPDHQDSDAEDLRIFEGEILLAAGQGAAAAERFSKVYEVEPEDEEAKKMAEQAAKKVEAMPEPVEPAAVEATAVETATDLDVKSVSETLFAPTNMSSETTDLFEKHFRGKSIRWSGKLTGVRTFTFDLVFGNEPGTRAVFEIHQVGSQSFSGRPVQAVVRFPTDAEDTLRSRMDSEMTFEGTLVGCDAFMRNLFVGDGKIG
jgi:hypothetical protein